MIKYYKLIIKNFDQLKNDNFDQVNFGQVIIFLIVIPMISKMLLKNDNIAGDFVFINVSRSTSHAMYRNVNILSIKLHQVIKNKSWFF